MKGIAIVAVFLSIMFFIGCGEKVKEIKETADALQKLEQAGKDLEQKQNEFEVRWKERQKKDDTLALPYQKLQMYLPAEISGYKANEPEGATNNIPGFSISQAKRLYSKPNAGDKPQDIVIEIYDYNAAYSNLAMLTPWLIGFSREDQNSIEKTFETGMKDVKGFEKYEKQVKAAEIQYIIGYRFHLTIRMDNQPNTDAAKAIAKLIKMEELAKM